MNDLAKREWKLMPKEPTAEMLAAARMDEGDGSIEATYRALFDAAPEQDAKPLDWTFKVLGDNTVLRQNAWLANPYVIVESPSGKFDLRGGAYAICNTLEEAKAYAQAHHKRKQGVGIHPDEADRLIAWNEKLQEAVQFVALWAWREDQPNATNKLTDAERLSAIKHHPMIQQHGGRVVTELMAGIEEDRA